MTDFLNRACNDPNCQFANIPHDHAEPIELCVSCGSAACTCESEFNLTDEVLDNAANVLVAELVERHAWLDFVRTPIGGELYRAPEYR
jgi:hypothetical protein